MIAAEAETTLAWLKRRGTKANREGMARYAIRSEKLFGVSVATLRKRAKVLGRNHELASALWDTGWHEARMLAAFVDRTPHAFKKVATWAGRKDEFVKRAGFALLASLALHDKSSPDAAFVRGLALIERESTDERNFVRKAVNWALRSIGGCRPGLHAPALELSRRLAASPDKTARWIGRDAVKQLGSPAVARRLAVRAAQGKR